jgi:hypothetical protein
MLVVWLGALLVLIGVLFTAAQAIRSGRLSGGRLGRWRLSRPTPGAAQPDATLEPPRPANGFGLAANWPGLALMALGAVLLLLGAVV